MITETSDFSLDLASNVNLDPEPKIYPSAVISNLNHNQLSEMYVLGSAASPLNHTTSTERF